MPAKVSAKMCCFHEERRKIVPLETTTIMETTETVSPPPTHHPHIIQDLVRRRGAILFIFTTRSTQQRWSTLCSSLLWTLGETLLLCPHTPDGGIHLLADVGSPAATPSSFHRWTRKPLPLVHPDSATTSTPAPQSVCARSTTWSRRASHPTGDAVRYRWMKGRRRRRRREKMALQPRGFVWMVSQSCRGDWGTWWMIALTDGTNPLQIPTLTCPRSMTCHSAPLISAVRGKAHSLVFLHGYHHLSVTCSFGPNSLSAKGIHCIQSELKLHVFALLLITSLTPTVQVLLYTYKAFHPQLSSQ